MMIEPEILFSHCNLLEFNIPRKRPVKPLSMSHHDAEPMKTPNTRIPAET
jgi:hypothetical protein